MDKCIWLWIWFTMLWGPRPRAPDRITGAQARPECTLTAPQALRGWHIRSGPQLGHHVKTNWFVRVCTVGGPPAIMFTLSAHWLHPLQYSEACTWPGPTSQETSAATRQPRHIMRWMPFHDSKTQKMTMFQPCDPVFDPVFDYRTLNQVGRDQRDHQGFLDFHGHGLNRHSRAKPCAYVRKIWGPSKNRVWLSQLSGRWPMLSGVARPRHPLGTPKAAWARAWPFRRSGNMFL